MSSLHELIPAYTTWKMFHETIIPALLNPDSSESTLNKLSDIVKTKDFLSIIVFNYDPEVSPEVYDNVSNKYKVFTLWILGRFFYLLSCDKSNKMHNLNIDIQWTILYRMCLTQRYVYNEISSKYVNALMQLNEHMISKNGSTLELKCFLLQNTGYIDEKLSFHDTSIEIKDVEINHKLHKNVIKLVGRIISQNILNNEYTGVSSDVLNCFWQILETGNSDLKLSVLKICVDLMRQHKFISANMPVSFISKFAKFTLYLEEIVCHEYVAPKEIEPILNNFFVHINNLSIISINVSRFAGFIINKEVFKSLHEKCSKKISQIEVDSILSRCLFVNTAEFDAKNIINSLIVIKSKIVSDVKQYIICNQNILKICLYQETISVTWKVLLEKFVINFNKCCLSSCNILKNFTFLYHILEMTTQIKVEIQEFLNIKRLFSIKLQFFCELEIINLIITKIVGHFNLCEGYSKEITNMFFKVLVLLPTMYTPTDLDFVFNCISFPFFNKPELICRSVLNCDQKFMATAKELSRKMVMMNTSKIDSIQFLNDLLCNISTGLIYTHNLNLKNIESGYFKISKTLLSEKNPTLFIELEKLVRYSDKFSNRNLWVEDILIPLLNGECSNIMFMNVIVQTISELICKASSQYLQLIYWINGNRKHSVQFFCVTCCKDLRYLQDHSKIVTYVLENFQNCSTKAIYEVATSTAISKPVLKNLFQCILGLLQHEDVAVKVSLLEATRSLLHLSYFFSLDVIKVWMKFAIDQDYDVRKKFANVSHLILISLEQSTLTEDEKQVIWDYCFVEFKRYTKISLQNSKFELQDTILKTIEKISTVKSKNITLQITKLLIYFIMMPTSKYSHIASNIFIEMANSHNTATNVIYAQHKQELCQIIMEMCSLNKSIFDYNLSTSLEKVSLILGYHGPKNFILDECRYVLPILMALLSKVSQVETLINEVANFAQTNLANLLISRYDSIFLHLFINESDQVFRQNISYIENVTNLSSKAIRRQNSKTILYELLIHFNDKKDRVLLAITYLAQDDLEDSSFNFQQIPEYLQPKFLGILAYFDMKLMGRQTTKNKVLLSLRDLLIFMGPKYLTPFRFKILAMLTTSLNLTYSIYPELNCDVWFAFIKSCEIEALGSLLASICVSLLPLMIQFYEKINSAFRYLIIENEMYIKEYICDLFFMVEKDIDNEICLVIKKYLQPIESKSFKDQLNWFVKYLSHDTTHIRIFALKYIKRIFEKNREELDQMILGFNGIDPILLQLLDILMSMCREKDKDLKLACGECIGELGAIEPSHLPRKYASEEKPFTFFITEDNFIVNVLVELTKTLQAEKNTQNMDRLALAIQEILKMHGISPDPSSLKHSLWNSFPETQREVMLPLLSSKYTMVQPVETIYASPIYGSKYGETFPSWINSWTSNLILTIESEKRSLLQVCFPSLKQDHKILMYFLPHILLHVLLEGDRNIHNSVYNEFMAVINSVDATEQLNKSKFQIKNSLSYISSSSSPYNKNSLDNLCLKVIFILLDFLNRWLREWNWKKGKEKKEKEIEKKKENPFKKILEEFLSRFNKLQLAICNYCCGEYPRALMYLEEHVKEHPNDLCNRFSLLTELYAQLDEPDGVAGVTAIHTTEPNLDQRLLALEVSGKLPDAAACYEQIPPPLKPYHLKGFVRCYLDLENVNTALNLAQGAMQTYPEYKDILLEQQAEPLWRLGQYERLNKLLQKPDLVTNTSWSVQLGRSLIYLKGEQEIEFKTVLDALKISQVESLGAASLKEGAYGHGYSHIAKLHAINELEQVERVIRDVLIRPNDQQVSESLFKKLIREWDLRLRVVQESVRVQEPILCLRRVAIEQAKHLLRKRAPHSLHFLNSILGESWLLSAKIARNAGLDQQAYIYALKAEEYAPPKLFLEKARLQWFREDHQQALRTLHRGLEVLIPEAKTQTSSNFEKLSTANREIAAEARLLIASYNDSISNVDTDTNTQLYKDAIEVFKEWEKSFVCLGQCYDRIFQKWSEEEKDTKGREMQVHMVNYFGKSLLYGSKFIYQSMPRMLSVWFDCGTRLLEIPQKDDRQNTLLKLTRLIDMYLERLPTYIFFTAFSQLVSRICHPQKQVYIQLKEILIKLILQYPQQSLWMLISAIKSSYTMRTKRCAEILNDSRLKTASMIQLVGDFTKLAEKLIELCNIEIPPNIDSTTVSQIIRCLPRLISKEDFSEIMIPTQKFRKLILPNPNLQSKERHNPFPNNYVHIVAIEEEIAILSSLQRPKKITFRGSDGKKYIQMLKPKDDLRKDFRLMEFNDIVNQLLSNAPDSRQRRLNIRLYSVVPLNEECGLIEWIPNLVGLRPTLLSIYKQKGMELSGRELKQFCCKLRDPIIKKREIFTKGLLPKHPPVLGEWFKKTFPDAQGWFAARTAYIRTTAVMSMVGYILGLGDRHGENILFDSTSGDVIHVDFNCLFNKGESFEWPERVPFRLTHNMVSAMGPLGVEGIFRKSCACTLKVLRLNTDTLMSIVTPFVYDPMVSWPRNALAGACAQTSEKTNEQAKEHLKIIQQRLQGIIKMKGRLSIPLSVEGHTNNLIQEATDIDNLAQMYIGWGSYL